jgi:tight adherence protein B
MKRGGRCLGTMVVALAVLLLTAGPAISGPSRVRPGFLNSRSALYAGLGAIFLALTAVLVVAVMSTGNRPGRRLRRQLAVYTLAGQPVEEEKPGGLAGSAVARTAVELAGRVVAHRGLEEKLSDQLESAGVSLRPAEWLLLHLGSTLLAPVGFGLLFRSLPAAVIGLVLGAGVPWAVLRVMRSRRASAFLSQLPATLQLLAGSLSAGYSLLQALDTVVREGGEPVASEFNRAIVEARLGVPVEDALQGIGERVKSVEFDWVVMAIRIQREVGGNLAEVLHTTAATLRERERLRRQVKVLSAEGRLSAIILAALPVLFAGYLFLVRRSYVRVLYTTRLGIAMLILLGILFIAGVLWLRKVVRVEV